jgi:hypothetical protein
VAPSRALSAVAGWVIMVRPFPGRTTAGGAPRVAPTALPVTRWSGSVGRGPASAVSLLSTYDVLSLQRSAGNAAVTALLNAGRTPTRPQPRTAVLQRRHVKPTFTRIRSQFASPTRRCSERASSRAHGEGQAPPGTRAVELGAVGALLVIFKESAQLVTGIVTAVVLGCWLRRTVQITLGDTTLKVASATPAGEVDRRVRGGHAADGCPAGRFAAAISDGDRYGLIVWRATRTPIRD